MSAGRVRAVSAGTLLAAAVLLLAAPTPTAAVQELRSPGDAADATAPLVALVALIAWALAAWLVLVVLATLAARLPGGAGRLGALLARRVAPAALRRTVELALGLAVAATVVGAGTASAAPVTSSGTGSPAASAEPSLDWPGTTAAPDLDWPTTSAQPPAQAPVDPPAAPPAPRTSVRAAQVPAAPPTGEAPVEASGALVVQPGDSLWRVAERDLAARTGRAPTDAQTAAAWPAWWAANRDTVGADPDLVHPGTSLTPPQDLPADPSSSDDA